MSTATRTARVLAAGAAIWIVTAASEARAQEHNSFAVGVNVSQRVAPGPDARGTTSFGLKWRLGHSDTGWGWHYGFGWYSANIDREIGGRTMELGRARVRPLLGGYGYTRRLTERVAVVGKVMGGYSFNSFHVTDDAITAFQALPAQGLEVKVGGAPIVKPEVSVWFDLNRRFGLSADFGYSIARPTLTVSSSLGRQSGRVRADAFSFSTGIVYKIF